MKRRIERSYIFSEVDIREAIIAWLNSKDLPSPGYVGDTDTVQWVEEPDGLRVVWVEHDDIA